MRRFALLLAAFVLAPSVWGLLSVPINQLLFALVPAWAPASGVPPALGFLLTSLGLSALYAVLSGAAAAALVRGEELLHAAVGGIGLLAVGIPVQLAYWDLLPLAHHLTFLGMLIPMAVLGGMGVRKRRASPPAFS